MNWRLCSALIPTLLVLQQPADARAPTDNSRSSIAARKIDRAAQAFFSNSCHVGLSIGVVDHGRSTFYNYGSISRKHARLPSKITLFEIGSVTKTVTGVIAARAILDRRMALDSDFRKYLPAAYPNLEAGGKPITLRTLATHTSGMPRDIPDTSDLFVNLDPEKTPFLLIEREKQYDKTRYLKELGSLKLTATPGENHAYSNIGIKLIGFGLENVYRSSLAALMKQYVFAPLHMTSTFLMPDKITTPMADGYLPKGNPAPHDLPNSGAAGGLISNAQDLLRYAAWHLDERNALVKLNHSIILPLGRDGGEALMWQVRVDKAGDRRIFQSGGVYGYSSFVALYPDTRQAYVLLANDGCLETQEELHDLVSAARLPG